MPNADRPKFNFRLKPAALTALLALASSTPLLAQEPPFEATPQAGQKLAQILCANCHLIDGSGTNAVTVGIPTFSGIANKPGQTGAHIESVLVAPHAPMPDMKLSYPEIQNLISYLDSLRTDKSLPPLQPATKPPEKPKHPTPS